MPGGKSTIPSATLPAPPLIEPSKRPVSPTFPTPPSIEPSKIRVPKVSTLGKRSKTTPALPNVSSETSKPQPVKKPVLIKLKLKPPKLPQVQPPPTFMATNLAPLNDSLEAKTKGKKSSHPPPQDPQPTWRSSRQR
ncbi:hypothetical protein PtB15_14B450 [Puccinia triticina]|nr:hypothetical protein PtB15_14B450 [Puccinia triticina]